MEFVYEREINYYETDKMGIVHHSNYIRFLEEARGEMLKDAKMPYYEYEKKGIMIPVLGVNCKYINYITYGDTMIIKSKVKSFNGVRLTIEYEITNKATNVLVLKGETKHCFTNMELKPVILKKACEDFYNKYIEIM